MYDVKNLRICKKRPTFLCEYIILLPRFVGEEEEDVDVGCSQSISRIGFFWEIYFERGTVLFGEIALLFC